MNIRGVVFDYGNVLSMPALSAEHAALTRISGLDAKTFDVHYWNHRRAYDGGEFDGEAYWNKIAAEANIALTPQQIADLIHHDVLMWTALNPTMVSWAQQVHLAGFRTGILSNIVHELVNVMEKQFEWIHELDHNVWSCRIGMTKPNPAIFELHPRAFHLPPAEILFIDDREENVAAARAVGYCAITFRDILQFRAELDTLGILDALPQLSESLRN